MKNKIIVENGEFNENYKPIIKIEIEDKEYMIYTKDELDDAGEIIYYASSYEFNDGIQALKPIENAKILELLDEILIHVKDLANKRDSEK